MKNIRSIIVALPGTWQKALTNNLKAHPMLEMVAVTHSSINALDLVEQLQPDLLMIDASIPVDDSVAIIKNITKKQTNTAYIVLADTYQRRCQIAQAGADYVLSTFDFTERITSILDDIAKTKTENTVGIQGHE